MVDFIDKKLELRRYFPSPAYNLKDGSGLALILDICGDQLNLLTAEAINARDQFLLSTSQGYYLREIGKDLDVFKPKGFRMRDQIYRQLVEIITNSPKNVEHIFERVLQLFFGINVFITGLAKAYSYQKNIINIDIRENALIIASSRDLYGTAYIHRTSTGHFDGWGSTAWQTILPALLPAGSTGITLPSLPVGIPDSGFVEIGTYGATDYETKHFDLSGNTLVFLTPTLYSHSINSALRGPTDPDDYPNGYLYNPEITAAVIGSYFPGVGTMTIGPGYEDLPDRGVCYIGTPGDSNFECLGFTRASNILTFYGTTSYAHVSGEVVSIPCLYRKTRAVLQENITSETGMAMFHVDNGADFPGYLYQGAVVLNRSFNNEEIIPFRGRSLGDNTEMNIPSSFMFKYDHAIGETVHLMSLKTAVDKAGTDFAFFINDTESLREQLFALLTRIKVVGCKIVFTVY